MEFILLNKILLKLFFKDNPMSKVLIIGAGGVGTVVAHKVAKVPKVFSEIMLASRNLLKM